MSELAIRIAILAFLLAISGLLLLFTHVFGPHHRSASDAYSERGSAKASHASNTEQPGHQSSPHGAERDASQNP